MKTIVELGKHLDVYREGGTCLPSYDELVELVNHQEDVLEAVVSFMANAKERESQLVTAAYYRGKKDQKYLKEVGTSTHHDIYRVANVRELE